MTTMIIFSIIASGRDVEVPGGRGDAPIVSGDAGPCNTYFGDAIHQYIYSINIPLLVRFSLY